MLEPLSLTVFGLVLLVVGTVKSKANSAKV